MLIFVEMFSGATYAVEVDGDDTIDVTRRKICEQLAHQQHFIEFHTLRLNKAYANTGLVQLEDSRTLFDYQVQNGTTLIVKLRLR